MAPSHLNLLIAAFEGDGGAEEQFCCHSAPTAAHLSRRGAPLSAETDFYGNVCNQMLTFTVVIVACQSRG